MSEVHAAGAVVYHQGDDGTEFAVIHRPRYDDWSLPGSKLDAGESFEEAALREVQEEIGVTGELGEELPESRYKAKGKPKVVRYWLMEAPEKPDFKANDEVDKLKWWGAKKALSRLSYDRDRELLEAAIERL